MVLDPKDAEEIFRLFSALDAYVNSRLKLVDGCTTPEQIRSSNTAALHKIRTALWADPDLLAAFVAKNPSGLTAGELAQVAAWKHAVVGQFYIERCLKHGAILVSMSAPTSVYCVLGLTESLQQVLYRSSDPGFGHLITTTLVPFKGRVVYDGFLAIARVAFGPGLRARYRDIYLRAKERGALIASLPPSAPSPGKVVGKRAKPGASVELAIRAVDALGSGVSDLEKKAFAVLKHAVRLASAAQRGEELEKDSKAVSRAMRRLEDRLDRDKWGGLD